MEHECIQERFARDVANHRMEIEYDNGVNRHIRFKAPGTSCMHFSIVTFAGHLCYTGDMGTYVFRRLHDMLDFFRKSGEEPRIDYGYWAEKCEASDKGDGIEKFSHDKFCENIRKLVDDHEVEHKPCYGDGREAFIKWRQTYAELREIVESEVCSSDENEIRCFDAATDFCHNDGAWEDFHGKGKRFEFTDFWEGFGSTKEYSFRFLWCCHALAWGVKQYDLMKAEEAKRGVV